MPQLIAPSPTQDVPAPAQAPMTAEQLAPQAEAELRKARDWPFPLHSPLPPSSLDGDGPCGFEERDLTKRCMVTVLALAGAARPVQAAADTRPKRKVGLPTAEVLDSVQEWFDRKPGLNAPPGRSRHQAMINVIDYLGSCDENTIVDALPDWMGTLDRACDRALEMDSKIAGYTAAAWTVATEFPAVSRELQEKVNKLTLDQASARIFSTRGGDFERRAAGDTHWIASPAEQAQVAALLQQPAGPARLMARIFEKTVRAHLGRPEPDDAHPLVACALGLLPAVRMNGQAPQQMAAAIVLRGQPPRAPALDDTGLPRCFQALTLQSPAQLAAQARSALGGRRAGAMVAAGAPAEDAPVLALLDTVLALARDLARIATDPLRAAALGFSADLFRSWVITLENDVKDRENQPNRLPARLKKAGDETTALYLTMDLLPRLHRWKSHHSAMAGPAPTKNDARRSGGYAEALRDAAAQAGHHPALPAVLQQLGRPDADR